MLLRHTCTDDVRCAHAVDLYCVSVYLLSHVYRQCRMSILTYLLRTYHVSNVYVVSLSIVCLMPIDTVECLIGRSINYRSLLQKSPIKETIFCVSIMCRMSMLCQCHAYRQCRMSILTYLLHTYHVSNVYVVSLSIICLMPIHTVTHMNESCHTYEWVMSHICCVPIMFRMSMLCVMSVTCRMSMLSL